MITVSGRRAGLAMGLIVTPPKIQHDGSRWNRKFGSGGSSISVGSIDCHASPRSWLTSWRVMPPMRKSATWTGSAVSTHSRARSVAPTPTLRSPRTCSSMKVFASGFTSASDSSVSARNTSTPRSRMTSAKASCSSLARFTHSTSSNNSSSALDGVSRLCSRPGRWTRTLRSLPTSEWAPSVITCSLSSG